MQNSLKIGFPARQSVIQASSLVTQFRQSSEFGRALVNVVLSDFGPAREHSTLGFDLASFTFGCPKLAFTRFEPRRACSNLLFESRRPLRAFPVPEHRGDRDRTQKRGNVFMTGESKPGKAKPEQADE